MGVLVPVRWNLTHRLCIQLRYFRFENSSRPALKLWRWIPDKHRFWMILQTDISSVMLTHTGPLVSFRDKSNLNSLFWKLCNAGSDGECLSNVNICFLIIFYFCFIFVFSNISSCCTGSAVSWLCLSRQSSYTVNERKTRIDLVAV